MNWKIRGKDMVLERALIMGILNVTPDSFSDGGAFIRPEAAVARGLELIEGGADILDLGGESTRPGAEAVSADEECGRLLPVLKALRRKTNTAISIDTTKPQVARACLEAGADIINDVSGLKESGPGMADVVRSTGAGLILMHRRGTPENMQTLAVYEDVIEEVIQELAGSIQTAREAGIPLECLAVDPGLGFAKTAAHNLEILRGLERFHILERPIVAGPSRKSFIGKVTGRENPAERDWGTAGAVSAAVLKGARIIRVHEPAVMRDVVKTVEAIQGEKHVRT